MCVLVKPPKHKCAIVYVPKYRERWVSWHRFRLPIKAPPQPLAMMLGRKALSTAGAHPNAPMIHLFQHPAVREVSLSVHVASETQAIELLAANKVEFTFNNPKVRKPTVTSISRVLVCILS